MGGGAKLIKLVLQTVKSQMIVLHFIRVYTVFKGKKDLQT